MSQVVNDDNFKQCSCGRDKAIFFCKSKCSNQSTYCPNCIVKHYHVPDLIHLINCQLGNKWTLLFEKIEKHFKKAQAKYLDISDLIVLLEEEHKAMHGNQNYDGVYYQDQYRLFSELYDQVIGQKRDIVEKLISTYSIEELLKIEGELEEFNQQMERLKYLKSLKIQDIFDKYHNILLKDIAIDKVEKLSEKSFKILVEQKRKVLSDIINEKHDPQNVKIGKTNETQALILALEQIKILDNELKRQVRKQEDQIKTLKIQLQSKDKEIQFIKDCLSLNAVKEIKNGVEWTKLFGVNKDDIFSYEDSFWTDKFPFQSFNQQENFKKSFKLPAFYMIPVKQILIICESGYQTILELSPDGKPLMDYFISDQTVNLTYISGAKDPAELATGVKGVDFTEKIWRINSFSSQYPKFKTRLGGYFAQYWRTKYGKDQLGQETQAEMAGFGLFDEQWGNNKKSFGIRCAEDYPGTGLLLNLEQITLGAVVYGK